MEWIRARRNPSLALRQREHQRIFEAIGSPDAVLAGPFAGMRYGRHAWGSQLLPKIAGTYELELHDVIERLICTGVKLVVDVGAAEGYYAVGLARRLPTAAIVTYDISPASRHLLRAIAILNSVLDRIDIRTRCDPQVLNRTLRAAPHALVICDCEGYEDILIDPDAAPELAGATILVELHDLIVPGLSERIAARLCRTHTLEVFPVRERMLADIPTACRLRDADALEAMNEYRGEPRQSWFLATPRRI